jgi:pimeloyl-ACP methyl ester carboxylesterase
VNFVLVHSPHGGSFTWQPVSDLLRARGHHVATPTFRATATATYWQRNVNAILRMVQLPRPVLVGHSGAGPLLAHVARWSEGASCLYVDAGFRKDAGVPPGLPLAERAAGVVPAWANDTDLVEVLPDAEIRRQLVESIAPLTREYFAEAIPYREPPDGSAYLLLSPTYAETAAIAQARGWRVTEITSHHYAMLTAPALVADAIERLAAPA